MNNTRFEQQHPRDPRGRWVEKGKPEHSGVKLNIPDQESHTVGVWNVTHPPVSHLWQDAFTSLTSLPDDASDQDIIDACGGLDRCRMLNHQLSDTTVRDAVILHALNDQTPISGLTHENMVHEMSRVCDKEPDHKKVDHYAHMITRIAQASDSDHTSDAYATAAYLQWFNNNPQQACTYMSHVDNKNHSLGKLVSFALNSDLPAPYLPSNQ